MFKVCVWLVVAACIYLAYQAGWFNSIINYFQESSARARQEQVIEYEDGSYSTVKYRNALDLMMGR